MLLEDKYMRVGICFLPLVAVVAFLDSYLETMRPTLDVSILYAVLAIFPHLIAICACFVAYQVKAPVRIFILLCNLNGFAEFCYYGLFVFSDDMLNSKLHQSNGYLHFIVLPFAFTLFVIISLLATCIIISISDAVSVVSEKIKSAQKNL